ncbi:MAG: hypothetical protein ABIH69_02315 [bacterium]
MNHPLVTAKTLPCLFDWLNGRRRAIEFNLVGIKAGQIAGVKFPPGLMQKVEAEVVKAGRSRVNLVFPSGISCPAIEQLFTMPHDNLLCVDQAGNITITPLKASELKKVACLGQAEQIDEIGVTPQAERALPIGSVLLVGQGARPVYTDLDLAEAKVSQESPVEVNEQIFEGSALYVLGEPPFVLAGSLEQASTPMILAAINYLKKQGIAVDPLRSELAVRFLDGFTDPDAAVLRQLPKIFSNQELLVFVRALIEKGAWEALGFLEAEVFQGEPPPREIAEIMAQAYLKMGAYSQAEKLVSKAPLKAQVQKKGKGRRHGNRVMSGPTHPVLSKILLSKSKEYEARRFKLQEAFLQLCNREIELEAFEALSLEVVSPRQGGRYFAVPWYVGNNREMMASSLRYTFFDKYTPELLRRVCELAKESDLFYDLLVSIVAETYEKVAEGSRDPRFLYAKVVPLILTQAGELREFLPNREIMRLITERVADADPRYTLARMVVDSFFSKPYEAAKVAGEQEKYEEAWEIFQKVWEVFEGNQNLRKNIVRFLLNWQAHLQKKNDYEGAERAANLVLGFAPDRLETRCLLVFYACQRSDYEQAISLGEALLPEFSELGKDDFDSRIISPKVYCLETLANLGHAYILKYYTGGDQADLDQAISYLAEAGQYDADYGAVRYYSAMAQALAGRVDQCLTHLERLMSQREGPINSLIVVFEELFERCSNISEERLLPLYRRATTANFEPAALGRLNVHLETLERRGFSQLTEVVSSWLEKLSLEKK